jgi:hypothetical protein
MGSPALHAGTVATGLQQALPAAAARSPIDGRERRLERKGPVWRTPMAMDVLRNLPFLRHVPARAVEVSPLCLPSAKPQVLPSLIPCIHGLKGCQNCWAMLEATLRLPCRRLCS